VPRLDSPAFLAPPRPAVDAALADLGARRVIDRIWARDHTVWRPEPAEIANRLGWLDVAARMRSEVGAIRAWVDGVRAAGFTHALLLGMGGSSLAPEVFRQTFGVAPGHLDLAVLDSTDPGAVLRHARRLDPWRTLFVVSTKSGGTVETLSLFKYFFNRVADAVGTAQAGEHFAAITDPGSGLADLAGHHGFRTTWLSDPDIGGRFSALSHFGLVPAALVGVDLDRLLGRAVDMMERCGRGSDNPAAVLGATMATLARAGRDKLTFILAPEIAAFGDWVEQLVAESTGKDGTGILPVVGEPPAPSRVFGDDRCFVHLCMNDLQPRKDGAQVRRVAGSVGERKASGGPAVGGIWDEAAIQSLRDAGHPVIRLELADRYDLGGQLFLWEMATAVAGAVLGIQPFDQPDVEAAKARARLVTAAFSETGRLPEPAPDLVAGGIAVYLDAAGDVAEDVLRDASPGADDVAPALGVARAPDPAAALARFAAAAPSGGYIAVQAYLPPTPATDEALAALRSALRARARRAVTVGYGPRFLHSTGQLHKGDAGRGVFVQFTADPVEDAAIPDEAGRPASAMTFGVLERAQALGDGQALAAAVRPVLRLHLGTAVLAGLRSLADGVSARHG